MKLLFAVLFTTLYGLSIRLIFGFFDNMMSIMGITFLMVLPVLIGYLTVTLIPYKKTHTATGAFFKPWLTCLIILFITIAFNIEGVICWFMIFPLFSIFAGFGGVIAFHRKKRRLHVDDEMDIDKEDWDKPGKLQISMLLFLPLIVGMIEGDRVLTSKEMIISKSVIIAASPDIIWKHLLAIDEIQPEEHRKSVSQIMGFPEHLKTILDLPAVGGKRTAVYAKGLHFDETITQYEDQHIMALSVGTDPSTISPTVLDQRIVIGGKYVEIGEDIYMLEQLPEGKCRLSLSSRFYINTPFNWYAGLWASYLMSDILQGELKLIEQRTAAIKK